MEGTAGDKAAICVSQRGPIPHAATTFTRVAPRRRCGAPLCHLYNLHRPIASAPCHLPENIRPCHSREYLTEMRPGTSWPEIRYQPPHSSPLSPTCHCLESPRGDHGRQRGPADRLELRCREICGRETATVSARHSKSVSATNMSVVFLSSGPPTGTYFLNHDSEALVLITSQWMSNVCAPLLPSTMSKCHQMRRSTTGTCSMD